MKNIISLRAEYEHELNVRGKNKKEKLVDIFSSFQKTGDELLLSNTQKDIDDFFEASSYFFGYVCLISKTGCFAFIQFPLNFLILIVGLFHGCGSAFICCGSGSRCFSQSETRCGSGSSFTKLAKWLETL